MAKKYTSSRYSQTSARRNSSHRRAGSIRTTAGAPACNCVGVPDCEGAVTVAIKLCAATFARGPMKSNLDYQNSSQRAETAPWSAAVLFILSLEGPRFCSRCHTTRVAAQHEPDKQVNSARRHTTRLTARIAFSFGRCRGLQFGALNRGDERDNSP